MMTDTARFRSLVEKLEGMISQADEGITHIKPAHDKWSLKEIIGHLIDSASNNHQRFVRLQIGDLDDFPAYEAERWIAVQKYNDMDWKDITALWSSFNRILLRVIEHMDPNACGNVWITGGEELSLKFIVNDYYRHLEWHIGHFEERLGEVIEYVKEGAV
jgi:hypothetical protein